MKKITILISIVLIIAGCGAKDKGWSASEKKKFLSDCVRTAKTGMSEDQAQSYCSCMEDKFSAKYPDYAEANKVTTKDMETPEMKKMVDDCLKHPWTADERKKFISDCAGSAKAGMTEEKANSYCTCMQGKLEVKYSSYVEANRITEDDLKTPEMKGLIADCLKSGWSSDDKEKFISSCTESAKGAMGEDKAKSYCTCMQGKFEAKYTTVEAAKITASDMKKSPIKEMIEDCLK